MIIFIVILIYLDLYKEYIYIKTHIKGHKYEIRGFCLKIQIV